MSLFVPAGCLWIAVTFGSIGSCAFTTLDACHQRAAELRAAAGFHPLSPAVYCIRRHPFDGMRGAETQPME